MSQYENRQYGQISPRPSFTPNATLRFVVQGNVMTSSLVPPTLLIDGFKAPTRMAGAVDIPVEAGRHRLDVFAQWMRRYGQAATEVDVAPGQVVEVYYAPPLHQFTTGEIGLTPQRRKGAWVLWVIFGVPAVIVVGLVALVLATV
ncbi:hypothetical protein [Myceligenerans crystallogenes]|uniref:hypothetical protein n=1 Tax=Myceligenerans crystallogenes TaxID=316335 RepID=UPI0031D21F5D